MADTVQVSVIENGNRNYVVRLQNTSDGTGESAVVKADASAILGPTGQAGTSVDRFSVKKITGNISGFTAVNLLFDATADDELATLGPGDINMVFDPPMPDPKSTGYTGDIKLTTVGAAAGDTYDLTLHLIKK